MSLASFRLVLASEETLVDRARLKPMVRAVFFFLALLASFETCIRQS